MVTMFPRGVWYLVALSSSEIDCLCDSSCFGKVINEMHWRDQLDQQAQRRGDNKTSGLQLQHLAPYQRAGNRRKI